MTQQCSLSRAALFFLWLMHVTVLMCGCHCPQADGQSQSISGSSLEEQRFPMLRWMLDVRTALARGNVPRRVVSLLPEVPVGRGKMKRKWSEQALLVPLRDKKTRKLMQRAERRAKLASSPAQPLRKKGSHAPKTLRGAGIPLAANTGLSSDKRRGSRRGKAVVVDEAAALRADRKAGRKNKQKARQGKDERSLHRSAKPARTRGKKKSSAGADACKQHAGWSAV